MQHSLTRHARAERHSVSAVEHKVYAEAAQFADVDIRNRLLPELIFIWVLAQCLLKVTALY